MKTIAIVFIILSSLAVIMAVTNYLFRFKGKNWIAFSETIRFIRYSGYLLYLAFMFGFYEWIETHSLKHYIAVGFLVPIIFVLITEIVAITTWYKHKKERYPHISPFKFFFKEKSSQ